MPSNGRCRIPEHYAGVVHHLVGNVHRQVAAVRKLLKRVYVLVELLLAVPKRPSPDVIRAAVRGERVHHNELYVVQGTAMVNGNVIGLGETVYVNEGDRIYTGQGAMAHLYFVDDSRVTMGPNTELQILQVEVDPGNAARTVAKARSAVGMS